MSSRRLVVLAVVLVAFGRPAFADEPDPVVPYLDAMGTATLGLEGAGIAGVDFATFAFIPNVTHPRLQLLLDYAPANATLAAGRLSAGLAFDFRLDVRDGATNETVASFEFVAPGSRYHNLNQTFVDGRTYHMDLYLLTGLDVDWTLSVRGWHAPIPI